MFIYYIVCCRGSTFANQVIVLYKGSILTNRPLQINFFTNSRFPGQGEQKLP